MQLYEPINTLGLFWLPEDPDNKLPGNLVISETGEIRVEVIGLFSDAITALKSQIGGFASETDRILGMVEEGGRVTLKDCLYQPRRLSLAGGLSGSTIIAQLAFIGAHFDVQEELTFPEFRFSVDGLEEWLFISGIEWEQDFENRRGSIDYRLPDEISISLPNGVDLEINFSLDFPQVSFPVTEVGVTQAARVHLTSEEPKSMEFGLSLARQLSNFLFLAFDQPVSFRSVEVLSGSGLENEQSTPPHPVKVHGKFLPLAERESSIKWHDILFRYSEVEDCLEELLGAWLQNYAALEPVLNLYFSNKSNTFQYLDVKCVHLAQSIEAIHRMSNPERTVMPKRQFEVILKMLLQCCPPGHREWLEGKLNFANEPSLAQRVKEMIEPFKSWFGNSKKRGRFVRNVVDTRNLHAHFSTGRRQGATSAEELLELHDKLDVLFQISLLRQIDFGDENIDSLLQNSGRLRRKLGVTQAD